MVTSYIFDKVKNVGVIITAFLVYTTKYLYYSEINEEIVPHHC